MGDYVKSTNFAAKDALSSGDTNKIVKGTEINTEYDNIATAVSSKADKASPTFTGTVNVAAITASSTITGALTGNVTGNLTGAVTGSLAGGTGLPLTTGVTGTLPVANGGTGAATLTANSVVLGNGTSAVQLVAPSTSGNLLTSNGTSWTSAAPPSSGVTSLNGQTGSITNTSIDAIGSVIIAVNGITVSDGTILTSIGTTYSGSSLRYITNRSSSFIDPISGTAASAYAPTCTYQGGGTSLSGTWRAMSASKAIYQSDGYTFYWYTALFVRVS